MNILTTISLRVLLIAGVFALALTALYLHDGAVGITFALEDDLDLTIGSSASRNGVPVPGSSWALKDMVPGADKFFDLDNVLPGDFGEATVSMLVASRREGGAWLCLDFANLASDENEFIEPEEGIDQNGALSGELAEGMEFFAWRDDGDNVFESGEDPLFGPAPASDVLDGSHAIADATTGAAVAVGATHNIGIAWCAGNLGVNLATGDTVCNGGALGSEAQTDALSVDIAIRAQLERGSEGFTCSGETLPDGRERPERPDRPDRSRTERPERGSSQE